MWSVSIGSLESCQDKMNTKPIVHIWLAVFKCLFEFSNFMWEHSTRTRSDLKEKLCKSTQSRKEFLLQITQSKQNKAPTGETLDFNSKTSRGQDLIISAYKVQDWGHQLGKRQKHLRWKTEMSCRCAEGRAGWLLIARQVYGIFRGKKNKNWQVLAGRCKEVFEDQRAGRSFLGHLRKEESHLTACRTF